MKKLLVSIIVLGFLCMFASISCAGAEGTLKPVYRFYNTATGAHFYTIDESEKDNVIAHYPNFKFEGIAFYAFTGSPPPDGNTRWGVLNGLGCSDGSPLTFSVTIDGTTKSSTTQEGDSLPSWEGYARTTAGSKTLAFKLSGACISGGSYSNSGSLTLEPDNCYVILMTMNEEKKLGLKLGVVRDCGDPRQSSRSFEENGEELGSFTLQNPFDYLNLDSLDLGGE